MKLNNIRLWEEGSDPHCPNPTLDLPMTTDTPGLDFCWRLPG